MTEGRSSILWGVFASGGLLVLYFVVVSVLSGRELVREQLSTFWYYLLPLALGFGVQIGLYRYIRGTLRHRAGTRSMLVATGTNSGIAMVSCCAHYVANILPLIVTTGVITLVGQYQVELFWFGLAANGFGVAYLLSKTQRFARRHSL